MVHTALASRRRWSPGHVNTVVFCIIMFRNILRKLFRMTPGASTYPVASAGIDILKTRASLVAFAIQDATLTLTSSFAK